MAKLTEFEELNKLIGEYAVAHNEIIDWRDYHSNIGVAGLIDILKEADGRKIDISFNRSAVGEVDVKYID